jgi:hypothetical protein
MVAGVVVLGVLIIAAWLFLRQQQALRAIVHRMSSLSPYSKACGTDLNLPHHEQTKGA